MKVATSSYNRGVFIDQPASDEISADKVQLILGFGARSLLIGDRLYDQLRSRYPAAEIVLTSTAGEIFDDQVMDDTVSIVALEFENTGIRTACVQIADYDGDSRAAGTALVRDLSLPDNLCYILVLADGGIVNGSELINGMEHILQHKVPITGGLAADGISFKSTVVGLNKTPEEGIITAIAFYGHSLLVTHCSMGGWEKFGPESTVTRSVGNRLFEINHLCALDLYKKYLGAYADDLPGSALLFPLSVQTGKDGPSVVRTILSIDAETGCMVFAGDIPNGSTIRFMKANFDKLIDAAAEAAIETRNRLLSSDPKLALLISCVGRKIILESRISEEVEAIRQVYSNRTLLTGFYSYGELSPFSPGGRCELHNQSMTITTFDEI